MKFLLDMGISPSLAEALRELGHDSIHVAQKGLTRLVDPEILTKAKKERRVQLTHDLGFDELLAASGSDLARGDVQAQKHATRPSSSLPGAGPRRVLGRS